jgi:4-alpha-glucanotransferase
MLFVIGDHPLLGSWSRQNALEMHYLESNTPDDFNWEVEIRIPIPDNRPVRIEYKYIVLTSPHDPADRHSGDVRQEKDAQVCWDTGPNRSIFVFNPSEEALSVATGDLFQATISILQHLFFKVLFSSIIYSHEIDFDWAVIGRPRDSKVLQLRLRVIALQVPPSCAVLITGSHPIFENWSRFEALRPVDLLSWEFSVDIPFDTAVFDYKYVIRDPDGGIRWEKRGNRKYFPPRRASDVVVYHDWLFQADTDSFTGAGIAVRLEDLYTEKSLCQVGGFMDLKVLIDWAVEANLLLIQLYPIHDINYSFLSDETCSSRQVSAFAFNPLYLSLSEFGSSKRMPQETDLSAVARFKMRELRLLYENVDREALRSSPQFIDFVRSNEYWLPGYCAWCAIRDDRISAPEQSDLPAFAEVPDFLNGTFSSLQFDGEFFHAWVQYQCHLQLSAVVAYATANRIALSCTMTIGQHTNSADAWSHPQYFDKNYTIGSAPDLSSFSGRNWLYPAWNWDAMRSDDFTWLRHRISHLERYFHGCLFDRPLCMFRCWSIPANTDNPLFGHFVPSIPIDLKDLQDMHIADISRLCRPLFPINDVLSFPMSESTKEKLINALATCESGVWRFRTCFESDRDVVDVLNRFKSAAQSADQIQVELAKKLLLSHFEGVCLIPDSVEPHRKFYPRYSMMDSSVFNSLPERDAHILYQLFVDFYYRTNIPLWHEQGHEKLSVLASSGMQLFGYDIGVAQFDEEKDLHRIGMCSYRVQRLPRDSTLRFDHTSSFPYLSICSPSCPELPPLASWWRNSQADAQLFFNQILKIDGIAPPQMTPQIARRIIELHLDSGSMWSLFHMEDLAGLTEGIDERIPVDRLANEYREWTREIAGLVEKAHRGRSAVSAHRAKVGSGFP